MRTRSLSVIVPLTMLAMLTRPASAVPGTLEAYVKIAGEVGTARSTCGLDIDTQALFALGRPFAAGQSDQAALDRMADAVADGLNAAGARLQRQGSESFCREMLEAYGPNGKVHPGLLKGP
jgi:hypothetical protein